MWRDRVESILLRVGCLIGGHKWDSDRPAPAIHMRDICWRCDKVRDPR